MKCELLDFTSSYDKSLVKTMTHPWHLLSKDSTSWHSISGKIRRELSRETPERINISRPGKVVKERKSEQLKK